MVAAGGDCHLFVPFKDWAAKSRGGLGDIERRQASQSGPDFENFKVLERWANHVGPIVCNCDCGSTPPPPVDECIELICNLATGGFSGSAARIALHPDGDVIAASNSVGDGTIGLWEYPSGNFIGGWDDGMVLSFDDIGNLYWADRVGTGSRIKKGTSGGGSTIYTLGGDWLVSQGYWHNGFLYFGETDRGSNPNRVVKIGDTGTGHTVLYDDDNPELGFDSGPWITEDGAIWFYAFGGPSVIRLPPTGVGSPTIVGLPFGSVINGAVPSGNDMLLSLSLDEGVAGERAVYNADEGEIDLIPYACFNQDAHLPFVTAASHSHLPDRSVVLALSISDDTPRGIYQSHDP